MRALITGSGGFVGGHLIRHLVKNGDEVLATYAHGIPRGALFATAVLDICDPGGCYEVCAILRLF